MKSAAPRIPTATSPMSSPWWMRPILTAHPTMWPTWKTWRTWKTGCACLPPSTPPVTGIPSAHNGQNLYGYIGTQGTKYTLLMWELETVFGNNGSWGPGVDLFTVNGVDQNMQNIYNNPTFLRMYWRAMQELINGPLNVANSAPLLMAKYNAFHRKRPHRRKPRQRHRSRGFLRRKTASRRNWPSSMPPTFPSIQPSL
jgi:hypothetical protein